MSQFILPISEIQISEVLYFRCPVFLLANPGHHTLEGGPDLLRTTAQQATLKTSNQTSSIWNHDPRAHSSISRGGETGSRGKHMVASPLRRLLSMQEFSRIRNCFGGQSKLTYGIGFTCHSACSVLTLFLFLKIIIHYSFRRN